MDAVRSDENDQSVVRICTFNLRHDDIDHNTRNAWEQRRPIVYQCLRNMQPTIIGTQEGIPQHHNDILADLNQSAQVWSYTGDELQDPWHTTNAIYYRHDIFSLISTKTFWFNEHPSTPGPAWGAKNSRGCTRAHFQHKVTRHPFIVYNLHIDYPSQNARHHSIPVLLCQIQQNDDHIDQVIVTGDFNNWPEETEGITPLDKLIVLGQNASEIEQMKTAGFVDTYQHGETPTFNGFRKEGYGPKIDFIWISAKSVFSVAGETKVDDYHNEDGSFPSDHFPVYSDLIYKV
ncbi:unnamed protein product [Adineta ricciae]|uniref:Endonuclease/exonuclease/phosphatase domain-containing protein n=1 Tax=Adineta ricciae TaxID=249248 RepID=A0A813UR78_ADIRI|nr:unnamed protein product [Adineta ricciae]